MTRKSNLKKVVSGSPSPNPLNCHHESMHKQLQNLPRAEYQMNDHSTSTSVTNMATSGASASMCNQASRGSDIEEDADEDDQDDEDMDEDVHAPSGDFSEYHRHQAGLTDKLISTIGQQNEDPLLSQIPTSSSSTNATSPPEHAISDNGDYNAVEDISMSETGLEDMDVPLPNSAGLSIYDCFGRDFDADHFLNSSHLTFNDENYTHELMNTFDQSASEPPSPKPAPRHVHFEEPLMPPSDSSNIVSYDRNEEPSTPVTKEQLEAGGGGKSSVHENGYESGSQYVTF